MRQQELLYGVAIRRHDQPSKTRLLWDGFSRPYLTAFRSEAVKEKRAAVESGWRKSRVVKVLAKFTWLVVGCWMLDVGCSAADLIPQSIIQPPRTYHFAATAVSTNGLESDYSAEVTTTNPRPTLAWDRDTHYAPRTTFHIYRGTNTGLYTTSWPAGTAYVFSVPSVPLPTNRVLTITTTNATNIAYRPWTGTWMLSGKTNLTFTNPSVSLEYRPLGPTRASPARASITLTNQ
ncbi:MAG: hypothetical protein ABFD89_05315 [Bryobacteraceae bacterium]